MNLAVGMDMFDIYVYVAIMFSPVDFLDPLVYYKFYWCCLAKKDGFKCVLFSGGS
jgi:hypothetical protein